MTRSNLRIVSKVSCGLGSTIAATILLSSLAAAIPQKSGARQTGAGGAPDPWSIDLTPRNKLVFPYGVQTFERKERLEVGSPVTAIQGWTLEGAQGKVSAVVAEFAGRVRQVTGTRAARRPATSSRNWLAIEDHGAGAVDGIATPFIHAPAPWDYAWTFGLQVTAPPAFGVDGPALAIQHRVPGNEDGSGLDMQDAWGVRLTPAGAELYTTSAWGRAQSVPLFTLDGATGVGEWVDVRVVASLSDGTLAAFVNGAAAATIRTRPPASTDVTRLRFSYHGSGAGNAASILLDDVGVAFLNPTCLETVLLDFETADDLETLLGNAQAIDTEFGEIATITGAGANLGPVTFDSTPGGPNDPSINEDMLIGHGNLLLLQHSSFPTQTIPGFFDTVTDDDQGGDLIFDFARLVDPQSVLLADINPPPNLGASVTLIDGNGAQRVYTIPPGWTGTYGDAGPWLLDLTSSAPQIGNAPGLKFTTVVEDPGFVQNAVTQMIVNMTGFGAMDELLLIVPCVQLDFETEDDSTVLFAGTPLANGQDISDPPEFGLEVSISDAGANAGAAIFESTPGGDNDPGPDLDLLVGLGNVLILQSNNMPGQDTQTVAGVFDTPNDDVNGGDVVFAFPAPVTCHQLDLIDVDEEEPVGVIITLLDSGGNTRVFTIPVSWTEDRLNDGPPAFRTLDLETLAPQPGFASSATAVEDAGFDPGEVVQMTVSLGGSQAIDNFCFCP